MARLVECGRVPCCRFFLRTSGPSWLVARVLANGGACLAAGFSGGLAARLGWLSVFCGTPACVVSRPVLVDDACHNAGVCGSGCSATPCSLFARRVLAGMSAEEATTSPPYFSARCVRFSFMMFSLGAPRATQPTGRLTASHSPAPRRKGTKTLPLCTLAPERGPSFKMILEFCAPVLATQFSKSLP